MQGRLIAIEGADSSGKHTQAEMLLKRLCSAGHDAVLVSFPRYDSFSGQMVKKYLQGDFGSIKEVVPEFSALLFSLDRFNAMPWIKEQLQQGKTIVCDRYSASNIAHQGAKFHGKEQGQFIKWLSCVESRLPKPNATIFLDLPVSVSQELMQQRERQKDLHETNIGHLEATRMVFLSLSKKNNWIKIDCKNKQGGMQPKEEIHEELWKKLQKFLK